MVEITFKVGDKVQIRKDSCYYGESDANPMNVPGKVINIIEDDFAYNGHSIRVAWDNSRDESEENIYRREDLEYSNLPFYV